MAAESHVGIEVIRFAAQAIVVVIGWAIVHNLSAKRDRDKARREMLAKSADSLGDSVDKLLGASRKYHVGQRDVNAEIELKMALQDLNLRTGALSDISVDTQELAACRSSLLALKRAITGRHFEDEHESPLDGSAQQLQEIAAQVLKAKQCFLKLKHKQFPVR